ncbi:hypothetical protein H072_6359 [Dactylellina haptotyla CBS 200.50]|uniref:HD/PDEase domain-containing protein n=1 Tax=Dactylellina haptotyla (strain CBS 200.50) TaxID=1284197 RepID=S8BXA0_DACHA|nr:hypothetical protein H072_6359 [Dactylellina haptotyla CBS 200.50]
MSDPANPERLTASDRSILPALLSKTHAFVKDYMSRYDSSHDFSHVLRVLHLALHVAQAEQKVLKSAEPIYDTTVITLAALLHDVGDKKYIKEGEVVDPCPVKTFLVGVGASEGLGDTVQTIVDGVSYSKEIKDPQRVLDLIKVFPELAVVQDADRIDAIGAVGIGRTFTYSGAKGAGGPGMENVLKHFEEKLLRLGDMMKTATGKELAEKRLKILRDFEKCWLEEKSMAGGVEINLE